MKNKKKKQKKGIVVRGARVHNLKNISVEIPRNELVVITGVSGSGKSSLAFDTIYAEGQRRFVESLSSYARQFLERMNKPDVDFIQGISPAIAIEQKTTTRNPRSTVGTTTEVYDYMRLLFGRIGKTYCPGCGNLIEKDSVASVIERIRFESGDAPEIKLYLLFPIQHHKDATLKSEIDNLKRQGFFRLLFRGEVVDLNEKSLPAKAKLNELLVLVDRLNFRPGEEDSRIADSIETAFKNGGGYLSVSLLGRGKMLRFSRHYECPDCAIKFEEPDPRLFSFNNPFGACRKCEGFGRVVGVDMDLVVPDDELSIREGAIQVWNTPKWHSWLGALLRNSYDAKIRVDLPFGRLTGDEIAKITDGVGDYKGIRGFFKMVEGKSYKIYYRVLLSRYRGYTDCDQCRGSRLRPEALNVRIGGKTIHEIVRMTINESLEFFLNLKLSPHDSEIGKRILEELKRRLGYLRNVGIGYLSLDRQSSTLSGGESQRINLSTALGSSLIGSLYVLDEPSIGLHPRDNEKLINILKSLRDVGNTVIVVEHDADMMKAADQIIDMGPHAGESGGEIVFQGGFREIVKDKSSLTGRYLSGATTIPVPAKRRKPKDKWIVVRGASHRNLDGIDVEFPLQLLVAVTGVSGSGKSTLVHDILYAGIRRAKGEYSEKTGTHQAIEGTGFIDRVELVDQSPIGKTSRSNPITYLKVFDLIRELFASTQSAKIHGCTPGFFSFNVPGGRCETCEGTGVQKIEMQFLADLELTCEVCDGKRFKKELLDIRYRNKNINDLLEMTVSEAIKFFGDHAKGKRVSKRLGILDEVGLGYVRLGQSATTLSGGEAQRVKLASHIANQDEGKRTLFIFDEPTTGLHFDDVSKLLKCFDLLVERGNSVVIIEHNMDVIKCADWVIDLGPEAGAGGGRVIAVGTPEEITRSAGSHTGKFLRKYLEK